MRMTKQGLSLMENSFELKKKHSKLTYSKLLNGQMHQAQQYTNESELLSPFKPDELLAKSKFVGNQQSGTFLTVEGNEMNYHPK